jgi:ribosomal protein L32E
VTDGDLIFRNQAKARFVGERFEHLYRGWKAGRVTESDIRQEFGGSNHTVTADFGTELLRRFGAPEREPEGAG